MSVPFIYDRPELVHHVVCDVLASLFPAEKLLFEKGKTNKSAAWLRQIGIYIFAEKLDGGRNAAAALFRRDVSTVIHAIALVEGARERNPILSRFIDFFENEVLARLDQYKEIEISEGWESLAGRLRPRPVSFAGRSDVAEEASRIISSFKHVAIRAATHG